MDYEYYYTIFSAPMPKCPGGFGRPRFNPWLGLRFFLYSCNSYTQCKAKFSTILYIVVTYVLKSELTNDKVCKRHNRECRDRHGLVLGLKHTANVLCPVLFTLHLEGKPVGSNHQQSLLITRDLPFHLPCTTSNHC